MSKNIFQTILHHIPDKTRIFLLAFWVWTWILFKLTQYANFILGLIIIHLPKYLMPNIKSKTPIKIIKAMDGNGKEITDKLNMFINFKWDKNMFDTNGGVDLDIFFKYIGSSVIWVAYILDYEINNNMCTKFINFVSKVDTDKNDYTIDHFKTYIKIAVIDIGSKIINKLQKDKKTIDSEEILFGEVNFY